VKDKKDIVSRAIILLCLSDRCALEKGVICGKSYSMKARETQQKAIYKWLTNNKYLGLMNSRERAFFEKKIGTVSLEDRSFFRCNMSA
jgi:hypothetical protein